MKSATVFLVVLLTGSRSNCYPVSEGELTGDGNWLSDEFLEKNVSPSLLDHAAMETVAARPNLRSILLPPTIDFQMPIEEILQYDSVNGEDVSYPGNPIIPSQPSKFLEPPMKEFGSQAKTMAPAALLDLRNHRTSELLPYGSPFSHRFPATATRFASPLDSSLKLDELKSKEQKKPTKLSKDVSSKDSVTLKKNKLELKQKGTKVQQITPVAPAQFLVPPVNEFKVQVPKILMPPTREFPISDDI